MVLYLYKSVMQKIMRDRAIRKAYEAAKTNEERMEIICETAYQMGRDECGYEHAYDDE